MILEKGSVMLIRRHKIKLAYIIWRLLLNVAWIIWILAIISWLYTFSWILALTISIITFVLLQISFIRFILELIWYYNNIIIVSLDQIMIIQSTLVLIEDIEILEIGKINKINVECRWLFANIFWYWRLIIEQQRFEKRPVFFIPDPYKVMHHIENKAKSLERLRSIPKNMIKN